MIGSHQGLLDMRDRAMRAARQHHYYDAQRRDRWLGADSLQQASAPQGFAGCMIQPVLQRLKPLPPHNHHRWAGQHLPAVLQVACIKPFSRYPVRPKPHKNLTRWSIICLVGRVPPEISRHRSQLI